MNNKKATKVFRKYKGSDAYMCESARINHTLLLKDLPLFTAFDSTITQKYCDQFLAAIDQADTVIRDQSVRGEQRNKTAAVNDLMVLARKKYVDVMYFAGKAFPEGVTIRTFGYGDYQPAIRNNIKMLALLGVMETAAGKNRAMLNDVGFSDAAIDSIGVLKEQLQEALTERNTFKNSRARRTEERIAVLNACYNMLAMINNAAQLVFAAEAVKQKQYVYLPLKVRQSKMRVKKMEIPFEPDPGV